MINFPTKYPPYDVVTPPILEDGIIPIYITEMPNTQISGQTWLIAKTAMSTLLGGDDLFELYLNQPNVFGGVTIDKIRVNRWFKQALNLLYGDDSLCSNGSVVRCEPIDQSVVDANIEAFVAKYTSGDGADFKVDYSEAKPIIPMMPLSSLSIEEWRIIEMLIYREIGSTWTDYIDNSADSLPRSQTAPDLDLDVLTEYLGAVVNLIVEDRVTVVDQALQDAADDTMRQKIAEYEALNEDDERRRL